MVKIECAPQISVLVPHGKAQEFIWMLGQPWPIAPEDDEKIARIEAFGDELDTIGPRFSGGHVIRGGLPERELCRTWYTHDARYISEQMRVFYP